MTEEITGTTKRAHTPQIIFGGVCALFVVCFALIFPHTTHAEYIESFVSDITVHKDSTFEVTERVTYVFEEERHGIFRCIPELHQEEASSFFKERYIDISFSSVRMDGGAVPYTLYKENGEQCAKIGDPDKTITGKHLYEITFTVGGAISYADFGGAELYYNATGNEWGVPMERVEARVSSPDQILLRERACYRGTEGINDSCKSVTEENGSIVFKDSFLNPGEGITIAQALNRTAIQMDIRERYKLIVIVPILLLVSIIALGIGIYRYKTKFKTGNTIIAQYEPYPEVKPMYAGFLFDKRLDPRDITAGIVYLAQQGFIKIRKTDRKVLFFFEVDDYEIELLRPVTDLEGTFEKEILVLIFSEGSSVGTKSSLHELKESESRSRKNYYQLRAFDTALVKDLKDRGFFTNFLFTRRTRKGYEALDHLKGFKDFLRVTEKERYIFHNAPERNVEQFMEFLPYAIAFGVEKEWAKAFESITIPNPDWYDGSGGVGTFNAMSLTQSLGGFSTAFASSSGTSASSGGGSSGGGSGGGGGGSW